MGEGPAVDGLGSLESQHSSELPWLEKVPHPLSLYQNNQWPFLRSLPHRMKLGLLKIPFC